MPPNNNTCDLAQDMRTYVPFIIVLCNHSILGFISSKFLSSLQKTLKVAVFLCIKQGYRMHFTYFHINCKVSNFQKNLRQMNVAFKILIYFLLFSCVFHSMFHGTIQVRCPISFTHPYHFPFPDLHSASFPSGLRLLRCASHFPALSSLQSSSQHFHQFECLLPGQSICNISHSSLHHSVFLNDRKSLCDLVEE